MPLSPINGQNQDSGPNVPPTQVVAPLVPIQDGQNQVLVAVPCPQQANSSWGEKLALANASRRKQLRQADIN
jgi:hypothetical protein